jgi:uncharacterized membrane protein YfcA
MIPALAWWQWAVGALCAFLIGASKTGLPGLGVMVVPMMVLTVGDARQSAGWLLPILCTADLLAVWYWRKNAAVGRLFSLAPWVLAGIGIGAAALAFSERVLRPMIGVIIFVMLAVFLYRKYRGTTQVAAHPVIYGTAAGFATTVANAAGPVMNLYLLSKRLPKEDFIATGAWFFFFVNLAKVPIYIGHGLFSRHSLAFDALLAPAIFAGAFAGRILLHRIPPRVFEALVIGMTIVATVLLFR